MHSNLLSKEKVRSQIKNKLNNIPNKIKKDSLILENLKPFISDLKIVMIYYPLKDEPNLLDLNHIFKNITFVYPKVSSSERKQLIYLDWESYNSPQFNKIESVNPLTIEAFILPAVGYSKNGTRLGRGGGYFDRSLIGIQKKKLIGVSYCEHFPVTFPSEPHDLQVGTVVTESESFFMLDDFSSPDTI